MERVEKVWEIFLSFSAHSSEPRWPLTLHVDNPTTTLAERICRLCRKRRARSRELHKTNNLRCMFSLWRPVISQHLYWSLLTKFFFILEYLLYREVEIKQNASDKICNEKKGHWARTANNVLPLRAPFHQIFHLIYSPTFSPYMYRCCGKLQSAPWWHNLSAFMLLLHLSNEAHTHSHTLRCTLPSWQTSVDNHCPVSAENLWYSIFPHHLNK